MDLDAKKLMLVLLERQKEYVVEDLKNYSCAMVAGFDSDGKSWLTFPKFDGFDEKRAIYGRIAADAIAKSSLLLITVNNARTRSRTADDPIDLEEPTEFDETNSRACIVLTASGPQLESCSLTLPYDIQDGQVLFDSEPEWLDRIELNLLPGWPPSAPSKLV
jgi:hypothetical protein